MFIPQSQNVFVDVLRPANYSDSSVINSEDSDTPSTFYPALLFVIFTVVFYGMALWDRWINLRMRELDNRPIYYRSHAHYGSVSIAHTSRAAKNNEPNIEQNGNSLETPHVKPCRTDIETT